MAETAPDKSLQLLLEAGIALSSGLALEDKLEQLVEVACRLTSARYGALGVVAPSGNRLERFITHGLDDAGRAAIGPEPTGLGILGVLLTYAEPLRLTTIGDDPRSVGFPPNHPPMTSFLGVPITVGNAVFGNLYLTDSANGEFSAADEGLAVTLAAQAAVAVENARLYTQIEEHAAVLERAVSQLSAVRELNEAILSGRDFTAIQRMITDQLCTAIPCRTAAFAVLDEASGIMRVEVASGEGAEALSGLEVPAATSKMGRVLRARRTTRVDDLQADPQVHRDAFAQLDLRSAVICPLVYRDRPVGVLISYDRPDGRPFTDDDVRVAELFAARSTLALGMSRALSSERERAEAEMALIAEEHRESTHRTAARRVVAAQEAERRRIARELHDDTGQALASALMSLRRAEDAEDPETTRQIIVDVRETLTTAIRDLRALAVELRPTALDDFGLAAALERLASTFGRRTGIDVHFHGSGMQGRLPEATETALYRIAQESLTNAAKHAGAGQVSIVLQRLENRIVLVIEDDGSGFDTSEHGGGLGLVSIRERAELVDGVVRIESSPDQGTTVAVEVSAS